MVTTRRSASKALSTPPPPSSTTTTKTPKPKPSSSPRTTPSTATHGWTHAPTKTTQFWLCVSLPLVIWDSIYVLGRPHTMEGGWLHAPLWTPYKLYGEVDHVYGWKAFHARSGFTAAQGLLNVVETAMYLSYVYVYATRGTSTGGGSRGGKKVLTGRTGAFAVLVAFSAAVMTLSKTVLYWANEYYSGFDNIGHNPWKDLVPLWIIPNGAWIVFSTYMVCVMGGEIIDGLMAASEGVAIKSE